ncbi:MAG: zinc dependent phospholipase C family protein [Hungatella sp.]|nr:zinc dependent phospholipase C family protein [Hungatella sp.]
MPTTYAHYRFGRDVYRHLPEEFQNMIHSHGGLYNIGLHGPDLLFYYRIFQKNPVSQTGFDMHAKPARDFFLRAARVMQSKKLLSRKGETPFLAAAKYAYLFGFLCHFALDSNCHPYVEQMVRETGISHSEIEAELDRDLMMLDGLNPMTCRPTSHLRARIFYGNIIARFFPRITPQQILSSIRYMKICCNLLAPSGQRLRSLLRNLMKGGHIPATVQDMIIKERPNPQCAPITRELKQRYKRAIQDGVELIVNFKEYAEGREPLDERLGHTFGEM